MTLPNAVTTTYGYDNASELTGLTYTLNSNTLGTLTYNYDLAGRRTNVGGSYARTNLPNAISTTAYDAGNELTQWGTATPTYDANGNVLSDGTNSYTWNARNQLVSMNVAAESFQYDAFGRRVTKTILATTTGYLYDGMNPIQELSGTMPTANLIAGGIDEYFQRTDVVGAANFMTDALGSTLALTDASGTNLAQYTYEPFGNTTTVGSSANAYQYTGRENDGTGIYFYRGRYYSPTLQRFISEDPIRFLSGTNFYQYVGDSAANGSDPLGFWSPAGHDSMISHALAPCGVSDKEIKDIQEGSRALDEATGTDPSGANWHSMAQPGQSADDAEQARNAFVDNTLQIAQSAYPSNPDFALHFLGVGTHPMMDLTSPAHTMPNGDPITWCGVSGCPGNRGNVLQHSLNDWTGIEKTSDITPDIYRQEDEVIRDAYTFVTGKNLACKKQ